MTWLPWHEAWQDALYGPGGFYRQPGGPAAHFTTSVHGIPGASTLMAQAIRRIAEESQADRVIDLGSGHGPLLTALSADDLELIGVDVAPRPTALDSRIGWWESPGGARLPDRLADLDSTVVVAHEWLDDVPCVVAAVDDDAVARVVEVETTTGAERLADPLDPADAGWAARHWPTHPGRTLDIGRTRDLAWTQLCERVRSGAVVAIDYGHLADARPPASTVIGYRSGSTMPAVPDGTMNVTAHVAMDCLTSDQLVRQRDILRSHEPLPPSLETAHTRPLDYLEQLAARSAWTALRQAGGLGDFWWAIRRLGPLSSSA